MTKKVKKDTISFGGLRLEMLNQRNVMVPKSAIHIHLPQADEKALALAVKHDLPALLIGETGTGKTSAVRQLAFLCKQGYVRINMHGFNTPDELIGSKSVKNGSTYYENGILTDAMLKGYMVVLDEINATPPDCLFIIHGLLDEDKRISLPNGDVIRPHKDFRFFATMNPDYEGTKSLNRAFLDRFTIILNIEMLKPDKEKNLLVERNQVPHELADKMVSSAWLARKAYQEAKTLTFVSTRSLLQWSKLVKEGMNEKAAYTASIVNKARKEEQQAFLDFYCAVFQINPTEEDKLNVPYITTQRVIKNYEKQIENLKVEGQKYLGMVREEQKKVADAQIKERQTKKILEDTLKENMKLNKSLQKGFEKMALLEKNIEKLQKVFTNKTSEPKTGVDKDGVPF